MTPDDPDDLDAWKPQEPSPDFAARVVAAARAEGGGAASPSSGRRALAGLLLAGTLAAGIGFVVHVRSSGARGDVVAHERREVRVGARAVAVLEPGAHVTWEDGKVTQTSGDVFWRVEPGAPLVVRAAGAEVTATVSGGGTCFRVKVRGDEDPMKRRDVIAGVAATAAVVAAVYEGRVALSRDRTSVELSAGEEGQADRDGARRTGERVAAERPASAEAPAEHALARLDRARADREREQLRALFAEAGALARPAAVAPAPSTYPTMPLVPIGDAGDTNVDPNYIRSVVRDEYFPLAKQCYGSALERSPRLAGTIEMSFSILGDPKIGGVVDDVKLSKGTTIDDEEMQTCLRESMMSVTFDAPPGSEAVTVVYPIVFSPEDDDAGEGR